MESSGQSEVVQEGVITAWKSHSYRFPRGRTYAGGYSDIALQATKLESVIQKPLSEDLEEQLDEHIAHKVLDNLSPKNKSELFKTLNTLVYVHISYKGNNILVAVERNPNENSVYIDYY